MKYLQKWLNVKVKFSLDLDYIYFVEVNAPK